MLENSISKTILKYALPNVVSMWIFTLYTMVDGIFISRYVGELGLAGVNLSFPLINLIFSISIMIGVGSSTLISIKYGENKIDEGNQILTLATCINIFISLCISLIIFLNINFVIKILGAVESDEVFPYVKNYLSYIILFSLFYMSGYAFEIYIKVDGKPIYPLICVIIGGLTNIVLDYILIVKFRFGVKGAAIATGISQMTTCSLLFFYIKFKARTIKFIKLKKEYLKKSFSIFKYGFSEFITEISTGLLILIYNLVILSKIGVFGVSIFGVISYLSSFIVMSMIGYSQGLQPVMSYLLGKKDYKNLSNIFKYSLYFLGFLGIICYFFINYFSLEIGEIFFKDIRSIKKVKTVISIYSFYYLFLGINIFISSYFTAIKRVSYSAFITFPRGILFNSLFLSFLPIFLGENGIWLSAFFSELSTLSISIYLIYLHKTKKGKE